MEIEILSPSQEIYKGKSNQIILPGEKGQFQILENHANIFSVLRKGEIIIGQEKRIPILSGIVGVSDNKVIILVESMVEK